MSVEPRREAAPDDGRDDGHHDGHHDSHDHGHDSEDEPPALSARVAGLVVSLTALLVLGAILLALSHPR